MSLDSSLRNTYTLVLNKLHTPVPYSHNQTAFSIFWLYETTSRTKQLTVIVEILFCPLRRKITIGMAQCMLTQTYHHRPTTLFLSLCTNYSINLALKSCNSQSHTEKLSIIFMLYQAVSLHEQKEVVSHGPQLYNLCCIPYRTII